MTATTIGAALCGALLCTTALAAKVNELQPAEVDAFLSRPGYVVVQLTSPDRGCTYCIGADRTFDQAAAASSAPDTVFARVQWPVWHKAPDMGARIGSGGLPRQIVFKDGKEQRRAGGRPDSAGALLAQIEKIRRLPPAPGRDVTELAGTEAAAPAPQAPLTAAQQQVLRVYTRKYLFKELVAACAKVAPPKAAAYERALQTWTLAHADALNEAAMLKLARASGADAGEERALVEDEMRAVEASMAQALNISRTRAPDATSCAAVSAALDADRR
jgi:hypothetical protein